jgi:uncharacterized caspase-like protein
VAADSRTARNSPFTIALLKHLSTPAIGLDEMMHRVRGEVYEATAKHQQVWTTSSLLGNVVLTK